MTITRPSLLTDDDLRAELSAARRSVDRHLEAVRSFTAFAHDEPWLYLDDVLRDLRAAATTVHVLEQLQGRAG